MVSFLLAIATSALADDPYYRHPADRDPYAGLTRTDGTTSCCGSTDCFPVPYDEDTGMMQLGDGSWVDPLNVEGVAIYFSFDEKAHACLAGGLRLVCALIPGSSSRLAEN